MGSAAAIAGLSAAGAGTVAGASDDTTQIRLEATRTAGSPAAYADEEGIIREDGMNSATEDWRDGALSTDTLLEVIDHWRDGTPVESDGTAAPYAWVGVDPADIREAENPTLSLDAGRTYAVEWTNTTSERHSFVVADDAGNVLVESDLIGTGVTQTVEFTAGEEMAAYYSSARPDQMRGDLSVGEAEPAWLTVPAAETVRIGAGETATHAGVTIGATATLALEADSTMSITG
jgi:plastocyanin